MPFSSFRIHSNDNTEEATQFRHPLDFTADQGQAQTQTNDGVVLEPLVPAQS